MSLLAAAAIVIAAGMIGQWLAWRLHMPAILLLLAAGLALGPGLGWLDVDATLGEGLEAVVGISVAIILFEGGLGLRIREIRAHGPVVARLVTLGAVVTATLAAVAAHWLLGLPWDLALLLGAVLSVTGPTVVLPLLHHVRPGRRTEAILRWEGILIDPVGAVMAVLVFEGIKAGGGAEGLGVAAQGLLIAVGMGSLIGLVAGVVLMLVESRFMVPDRLAAGVGLAAVVGAYVLAEQMQGESGLVAVTVMGVFLANQKMANMRHLLDFKEDLTTILLGALFVILAARVSRMDILEIDAAALWFVAALVLVVRPLVVALSSWGSDLAWKERAFLAWMAPRGIVAAAVSAFFALRLEAAGRDEAGVLVPVTFLVIVATVALYGLTARPLARRMGVAGKSPRGVLLVGANAISRAVAKALAADGVRSVILDRNAAAVTAASVDGLDARVHDALDPHLDEMMSVGDLAMMWAMTPNATTNALSAIRFSENFGRKGVYQVSVEGGHRDIDDHLRGRILWSDDVTYARLRDRLRHGWRLARTPLTDSFGVADWREQHGERALPAWLVRDGRILPFTTGSDLDAVAGDTMVAWVPKDEGD